MRKQLLDWSYEPTRALEMSSFMPTPANFFVRSPWEMIVSFGYFLSLENKKKSPGGISGNEGWKKCRFMMLFLRISCTTLSEWERLFSVHTPLLGRVQQGCNT